MDINLISAASIARRLSDPLAELVKIELVKIEINATRAENIIKYRTEVGPFKTRDEIKKVKAIGAKTFEQCAGFIRVDIMTANVKGKSNILDSTWVHPESYDVAKKIIAKFQLSISDIGTEPFITRIKQAIGENATIGELATQFRIPQQRV